MAKANRTGRVVVPHTPKWYQRLAAALVFATLRSVTATLRVAWTDRSGHFDHSPVGPAIYCVWHNRLALSMMGYFDYARRRNQTRGLASLVSASKDGGLMTAILECFGVQPVRGSTSRRGPQALLELTTWAERGYDLAITPDGPRGPCYVVQEGIVALAQLTSLPIVPASAYLNWKVRPKSWDRFQIPVPFSRCEVIFGPTISVPRQADDAERERLRQQLEQTLKSITRD
jgi:lysophospholipid acyltransferase (LPLAT)-like uncharacterized protein